VRFWLAIACLLGATACNGSSDETAPALTSAPATAPITSTSTSASATATTAAVPSYAFPISPDRGVSYNRTHAGYKATDVFAPCGAAYVAVTDGRLEDVNRVDRWDPDADDPALRGGLWVSIVGRDGVRYYGSHLATISPGLETGGQVTAGQEVGRVGRTGNAAGTPCHVHFGLSSAATPGAWDVRRGLIWPWPYLDSWREGGQRSPKEEVLNSG
jgi:peptidoglycan LD-endopeptidase LytH